MLYRDKGTDLGTNKLKQFLEQHGVAQHISPPGQHESNPVAESNIKRIEDIMLTLVAQSHMPKRTWSLAAEHAANICNFTIPAGQLTSPYFKMFGLHPPIKLLMPWGAKCFAFIEKHRREPGKLGDHAKSGRYVGLDPNSLTHKVLLDDSLGRVGWKLINTSSVEVDEHSILRPLQDVQSAPSTSGGDYDDESHSRILYPNPPNHQISSPPLIPNNLQTSENKAIDDNKPSNPTNKSTDKQQPPNPKHKEDSKQKDIITSNNNQNNKIIRTRQPPRNLKDYFMAISKYDDDDEPPAKLVYNQPEWQNAINTEIQGHKHNDTWIEVPAASIKPNEPILDLTLKLKKKRDALGNITKYKARICCRGDQQPLQDNENNFSPTPRLSTFRLCIALLASLSLYVFSLDVRQAFIQAYLPQPVFVRPTAEMNYPSGIILKLRKSLYGLRSAGANFHKLLKSILLSIGLKQSTRDLCLFFIINGPLTLILIHVDDLTLFSVSQSKLHELVSLIQQRLPTQGSPTLDSFIGIAVSRSAEALFLSNKAYITKCIKRFEILKTAATPSIKRLIPKSENEPSIDKHIYQAMVGSLLWISRTTRPDICFAVHELCLFISDPSADHLFAARRVFEYLMGTMDYALKVNREQPLTMNVYSDSDFHRLGLRKPTSGLILTFGGMTIEWSSRTQSNIATSTFAAELCALSEATDEAIYMRHLLAELNLATNIPTAIHVDNNAAWTFASRDDHMSSAKSLPSKFFGIKEHVAEGSILPRKIPSLSNVADICTKPLVYTQFAKLRTLLGVCPMQQVDK
jgi:hypothetical protein